LAYIAKEVIALSFKKKYNKKIWIYTWNKNTRAKSKILQKELNNGIPRSLQIFYVSTNIRHIRKMHLFQFGLGMIYGM
jgi:hypothetical protein